MPSNHICTLENQVHNLILPPLPPSASVFDKITRFWRGITLISTKNPRCALLFRSQASVEYECRRHLRNQRNVFIHPFSLFRMYWEIWMLFVLLLSLVLIPVHSIINFYSYRPFETPLDVLLNLLDCMCLLDILVTFNCGYLDFTSHEVVLDKRKVFRRYIFGFFILDFLSSIPSDVVGMFLVIQHYTRQYGLFLQFFTLLKVFRMNQFLIYLQCFSDLNKLDQNAYTIIWFVTVPFLVTHWVGCLHYLVPLYISSFRGELDQNSWIIQAKIRHKSYTIQYIHCLFRAYSFMLCIGHGGYKILTREDSIMGILSYIGGYILHSFIFIMIMQLILSYRMSTTKYQAIMNQVNEYMRHKKLPMQMQKKLITFYEYKYKKRYFREMTITNVLSDRLRNEINLLSCQNLIQSVPLLADLPEQLISKVVAHLKLEVYLPNDVIVKAGTTGDSMYFISSGTVMVQTPNGKEICHLQEGAYFGEIALVVKDKKRIATVVAIEICETFKLNKRSFKACFADNTDVYKKLAIVAEERLDKTVILEELQKKYMSEQTKRNV